MTSLDVKTFVCEFLKTSVLKGNLTYDKVEEIAEFLQKTFMDNLEQKEVVKRIPLLNDKFPELNGVVVQLIGKEK